jgi:hypothetical protein
MPCLTMQQLVQEILCYCVAQGFLIGCPATQRKTATHPRAVYPGVAPPAVLCSARAVTLCYGGARMPYGGNDWLALTQEPTLEPELPICDPHHHFWDLRMERIPYQRYLVRPKN